jgi:hypothetical protein
LSAGAFRRIADVRRSSAMINAERLQAFGLLDCIDGGRFGGRFTKCNENSVLDGPLSAEPMMDWTEFGEKRIGLCIKR